LFVRTEQQNMMLLRPGSEYTSIIKHESRARLLHLMFFHRSQINGVLIANDPNPRQGFSAIRLLNPYERAYSATNDSFAAAGNDQ